VRRECGYSLIEIVFAMAIFAIFLYIITVLTSEMRRNEKKWPVDFMTHPEASSVVARLRRDIEDTREFRDSIGSYTKTPQTLILYTHIREGYGETVVYDFRTEGEVHQVTFVGTNQSAEWVARGVPNFTYDMTTTIASRQAVHVAARDNNNRLAIDQIFVPRPHE